MKESYHPFRSKKAKETYLTYYDEYAKRWPIASEYKLGYRHDLCDMYAK